MDAREMSREIAKSTNLSLEDKLLWHFAHFSNRIPASVVPVCIQAIQLQSTGGDMSTELRLPDDFKLATGETLISAQEVFDDFKLEYFVGVASE